MKSDQKIQTGIQLNKTLHHSVKQRISTLSKPKTYQIPSNNLKIDQVQCHLKDIVDRIGHSPQKEEEKYQLDQPASHPSPIIICFTYCNSFFFRWNIKYKWQTLKWIKKQEKIFKFQGRVNELG